MPTDPAALVAQLERELADIKRQLAAKSEQYSRVKRMSLEDVGGFGNWMLARQTIKHADRLLQSRQKEVEKQLRGARAALERQQRNDRRSASEAKYRR